MRKQNKTVKLAFRTDEAQAERLQRIAEQTGQPYSAVLRQIVDSALLVQRPVIVSSYQGGPVQHAQ